MKVSFAWNKHEVSSESGYGITFTITYTSFIKDEIDKLEKNLPNCAMLAGEVDNTIFTKRKLISQSGQRNDMKDFIEEAKKREKIKRFLLTLGETGKIADKVSDLILFHNRVKKNAEARHI